MQAENPSVGSRQFPDHIADQLILAAEAVVRYRIATYRDRFKMTELQYRMMMHVARNAPISVGRLAALVNRDNAQVSRTVKSLVETGLMISRKSRGSVAKSLVLSPEGEAIYLQMALVGEEWGTAISGAIPSEKIALVSQAMEGLNLASCRMLERNDVETIPQTPCVGTGRRKSDALVGMTP